MRLLEDHDDIAQRVADRIQTSPRLAGVPAPVITEVLRLGLGVLAVIVPMQTRAAEIDAIEFEFCEGCGHAINPDEPEGGGMDGDGVWLCNACLVEAPVA